jgi:hypothetical protein
LTLQDIRSKGGFGRPFFMAASSPVGRLAWSLVYAAVTLAWLIPNHYPPWTSYYNEASMVVGLVVLTVVVWTSRGSGSVPRSAWFVVGVALIPWLQFGIGVLHYSGDAFIASAYVVSLAVAIAAAHRSAEAAPSRLALLLSFAALTAAVVSAVFAVSQTLQLASWGIWADLTTTDSRAGGNLAQANNFATLLGLGAAGAMYLYERRRLPRVLAFAMVGLLVLAGAFTQSRVSLALGPMFTAALWLLRARGVATRTSLAFVAVLTLLHWTLMFSAPSILIALFGEAPATLVSRGVATPRYQMWGMLLEAVRLRPWQGYGWLQVGAAELAVVDGHPPVNELWLQGHDVFIELVVWCGWPIGLLLSGALLFWYVTRLSRVKSIEAAVGMLAISAVGLHALVELPHHYAYFLVPAGLWAGIVEQDEGAMTTAGARWLMAPAVAALAIFMGIALTYPAVEEDFRLVRFEGARIGNVHASEPAPDAPLLSTLTSFLRFARTVPRTGMSEAQLAEMAASTKRYPYAASLARYASALALNGHPNEASRTFVKIRYIYGDKTYVRFRDDLRDKVAQGQAGLATLDALLPAVESLRP